MSSCLCRRQPLGIPNRMRPFRHFINALIDGLWLEGSMSPTRFKDGELSEMGLRAVENLLQMEL